MMRSINILPLDTRKEFMSFFGCTIIIGEKEDVVIRIIEFLYRYYFKVICHRIILPIPNNI